ncbi:MAG: NosD domain-containing protein [Archaeoglobaceae archaeon]
MRINSIIGILAVLFLVWSIFPAFAEDFTNVSECMDITQSGNYRLNQSIFGPQMFSGRDYCVGIFADDVVLDGNGYTLTGDSFGAGINITGNNVVVKNFGGISYYTLGIHVSNSQNFEIVNSTINQNNFHGIVVTFSTQGTIRNSRISGHDWYGVYLDNTTSTRIYNNSINGNYWGLGLYTSSSNFIYLNNFMGNSEHVSSENSSNFWNSTEVFYSYQGEIRKGYLGNYWSGYTGTDSNGDGVGDTAYQIDAENADDFPLIAQKNNCEVFEPIVITSCTEITSSGYYVLGNDISGQHKCLNISANNVVVYGNGHSIKKSDGYTGVYIKANKVTIIDLNVSDYYSGIELEDASNVTIMNCEIYNNTHGIMLRNSLNNDISNNTLRGDYYGLQLSLSSNNKIEKNLISNSKVGVELYRSNKNNILNNTFENCGLHLTDSYESKVENNKVNEKPLVYLENASGQTINYAGQIVLVNSKEITIRDLEISNATIGIQLWNSSHIWIENSTLSRNSLGGIYLDYSNYSKIVNSTISNNGYGIRIISSSNCEILRNKIQNNYGAFQMYVSNYNTIKDNIVEFNNYGFYLEDAVNNLIYNNLFNNTGNDFDDIYDSLNSWNATTLQQGTNILGGNRLGGNAWLKPDGTGFSQTCADSDRNGICDTRFVIDDNNIDYLPLKYPQPVPTPPTPPTTPTPTPTTTPRPPAGGGSSSGTGSRAIPGVPIYITGYITTKQMKKAQ